jgi:hypothetical protein
MVWKVGTVGKQAMASPAALTRPPDAPDNPDLMCKEE